MSKPEIPQWYIITNETEQAIEAIEINQVLCFKEIKTTSVGKSP